ncbi:DUF2252 domain-containing protein [Ilumatobacter sp.]|uniref:DUF2252 domain-containing protein n=1 Tax=Ilumatobacter sp. TaxID=1967498 RepID=UPI003AF5EB80
MGKNIEPTVKLTSAMQDRVRVGASVRDSVPLESHAELATGDDRPDPVGLLLAQDEHRLAPLVPIRHARMRVTPFTFYRGGAAIMASDLSRGPSTDLRVQLCGDAHLSNFGVFNGADRRLVFDINDFDETSPGPFEWDLKRLVASVTIAGRNNDLTAKQIRSASRAATKGYREVLAATLMSSPLDVHYYRIEIDSLLDQDEKLRKRSRKAIAKATRKDSVRALDKLTEVVDGERRIVSQPPLIVPLADFFDDERVEQLREFFDRYRASLAPHRSAVLNRYRFVDMAHKIVGVGSVGTRCLIVLLESDQGAPLFMQFKEATTSVLEPYAGSSGFERAGERVVRGQRLMQSTGDILLGWSHTEGEGDRTLDFYFRQLWDGKGSAEVDQMGPKRLKSYAWHCGGALALAHVRTGDGAAIHGYLGDDDTADHVLAEFGERYADLNEQDHAAHEQAIASGQVEAAAKP